MGGLNDGVRCSLKACHLGHRPFIAPEVLRLGLISVQPTKHCAVDLARLRINLIYSFVSFCARLYPKQLHKSRAQPCSSGKRELPGGRRSMPPVPQAVRRAHPLCWLAARSGLLPAPQLMQNQPDISRVGPETLNRYCRTLSSNSEHRRSRDEPRLTLPFSRSISRILPSGVV